MSKDYIEKIRNILIQSNQTVPYIFQRFYTVLKSITLSIRNDNNDPKIFEQYSLIYKTIKKYIIDEPTLLIGNSQKIQKQLKTILNPLLFYLKEDNLSKKLYQYFSEKENNNKINLFILEAEKIKSQILSKKLKIKVFGTHEMSNAFWIKKFKNQYAVHVDAFWDAFLQFIQQIDFFEYFISVSSKKSIMKKVDPQKKYFITSSNISQLFYKLSQPQFLQKLADQTAKGVKPLKFASGDFLELKFIPVLNSTFQTQLIEEQIFEISGQDTLIESHRNKTKHCPTIIFGSSVDSDVKIKNKYVSRKQFMIIQQEDKVLSLQSRLPFSLVCLSSSNFTMITYNKQQKLKIGLIFKLGQNSIQVVKLSNLIKQIPSNNQIQNSDEDQTLQYLPKKSNHELSEQKELQYLCISGPQKGKKGKLNKSNLNVTLQSQLQNITLIYKDNQFYLPSQIKIYVKTANQVINGQLSDKIPLEEGMKIVLEQCAFQIL